MGEVTTHDSGEHEYRGILKQICPQIGQTMNLVLPDGRLLEGSLCTSSISALLQETAAEDAIKSDPAVAELADTANDEHGRDEVPKAAATADETREPAAATADEAGEAAEDAAEETTELEAVD